MVEILAERFEYDKSDVEVVGPSLRPWQRVTLQLA